ncbi:MAG: family 20 glycosylhydrolase, partial [Thermoguttaceae bacterium]|nr:family 20 glycosylhydrolase [Thermoguttaceae bacterium]
KAYAVKRFKKFFGSTPVIRIEAGSTVKESEAYHVEAKGKKLLISSGSLAGVRYALSTIRQMAEALPGTKTVQGWFIPETIIDDAPSLHFRGLHLCWFPETRAIRIEQGIRMAAYYKYNYVVLELWGVYPYKALPQMAWAEHQTTEKELRRLVKLGNELGVKMIPQFNLFGHAAASRVSVGKHVLLDLHPEYASLFEPDGWTWCLSNPETKKLLTAIILELLDIFDNPEYFHIGFDEAYSAGTCKACRAGNYRETFFNHLMFINKLLAQHHARPLMWHDMLLRRDDPRWKGYVVYGNEKTDGLLERLPKDFILCDWQYGAPKKGETWPTMRLFKEKGFDVIACPWRNFAGIESQAKQAISEQYFGVLCTTWHHFFGPNMYRVLATGSCALWGTEREHRENELGMFNQHLRQVGWEIDGLKYNDTGWADWQILPETNGQ